MSWIISLLIALGVLLGIIGLFLMLHTKSKLKDIATVVICVVGIIGVVLIYTITIHMLIFD